MSRACGEESRLADAAEASQWSLIADLLAQGAPIDAAQADGMTALHWAAYRNHAPTVQRLLQAKCDPNAKTRYQVTPLIIAARGGHARIVDLLLNAEADPKAKLPGGETVLMIAARTGDPTTVRRLLRSGIDVNATERQGQTALMWAAAEGNADAVDALIAAKANINQTTKVGFTAMMFAARNGRTEVVKRLASEGVDVNAPIRPQKAGARTPRNGTSPLILAVESGHFELALELVELGADPNDQRSGFTPLHVLSWVRKPDRGENPKGDPSPRGSGRVTGLEFVERLVAAGADVNRRLKRGKSGKALLNLEGATPMLMAAKTADLPLLKTLQKLGGDPNITNTEGSTALMAAAGVVVRAVGEEAGTEAEVLETLDWLLKHGADVNAVDKNNETAMHGAAYRNYPAVVEYLAKQGADPAAWYRKNRYGSTPIMIAQGRRPGSFKPSPPTVQALRNAMKTKPSR